MSNEIEKDHQSVAKSLGAVPLKPAGDVIVKHEEEPPQPPEVKRIHPRRPLPVVPEAQPDQDDQ